MIWPRVVPFLILLILALLMLAFVSWKRRDDRIAKECDRRKAEAEWDNECKFDNPETGAKCERKEFHLENHYHDVGGRLVHWP